MSDQDGWNDPQNASAAPVKKKGMSGCMFATLIVGGLGLVVGLVCCGGLAYFGAMMVPTMAKTPEEKAAIAKQVLDIEMLPDFVADEAMSWDNMLFMMRIAQFKHKENKGELMMGVMKVKIGDPNQARMQARGIRDPFENKIRESIDIKSTELHNVTINGKEVPVTVSEGTDRQTNNTVHTVSADFEQGGATTFFILRMNDDIWDEEGVLKTLSDAKVQP